MLIAKSKVIMRMLINSQERGIDAVIHGQRVQNFSKIESVSDPHVRLYKLYKDGHYHFHFHQDYKISVQLLCLE
jgi:hypothetical protein